MTTAMAVTDGRGVAGGGVLCRECGYELRGLPREGACPECGAGVEASVRRHEAARDVGVVPMALSSPRWVRRVARGATLLLAVAAVNAAGTAVGLLPDGAQVWRQVLEGALGLGWIVLLVVGMWMLGAREPGGMAGRWEGVLRVVVRFGGVIYVGLGIGVVAVWSVAMAWGSFRVALVVLTCITSLVTWSAITYMGRLALRMGRPGLRRGAVCAAWVVALCSAARGVWGGGFEVTESHEHMIAPMPVFGDLAYAVLVPYSLAVWPRFGMVEALWVVVAAVAVLGVTVMAVVTRELRRAARSAA